MSVVIVTATERTRLEGNAPDADEIARALENARLDGAEYGRGRWIGPGPRITRRAVPPVYETRIAWVYAWPSPGPWRPGAPQRELSEALRARVRQNLRWVSGDWGPVRVVPWAERLNGPLAAWESGELAQTRTRTAFPTGAARLDPEENPIGPTTRDTRPSTLRDVPGDVISGALPLVAVSLALVLVLGSKRR
jgi:hypothetical protein